MTTAKLPRHVEEEVKTPTGRKEISAEGLELLTPRIKRGEMTMLSHPILKGAPIFFGLIRKRLSITKVIGAETFQPHEVNVQRTLAVAFAIFVLEPKADTTPAQDEWIAMAHGQGIVVHIARTWGEFLFALSELEAI